MSKKDQAEPTVSDMEKVELIYNSLTKSLNDCKASDSESLLGASRFIADLLCLIVEPHSDENRAKIINSFVESSKQRIYQNFNYQKGKPENDNAVERGDEGQS